MTDGDAARRATLEHALSLAQVDSLTDMSAFAAGVAHDVNNPLTTLMLSLGELSVELPRFAEQARRYHEALVSQVGAAGVASALGTEELVYSPERFDETLGTLGELEHTVQRLRLLAQQLGTFALLERSEVGPVDVRLCVEHALTVCRARLANRAIVVKELRTVTPVLGTPLKLTQVFVNLLLEAVLALEEGRPREHELHVRTFGDGDQICVEVRNTGIEALWEHCDLVSPGSTSGGGEDPSLGMGLRISRDIVAAFGGCLGLACVAGVGSSFLVRLPRVSHPALLAPSKEPRRSTAKSPRGRVLVVDDEAAICAIVAKLLAPHHDVVTCGSGEEAQALLRADRDFDVVFLDLMMPGLSGMDLHAWLAERDQEMADRVVFVTGGAFTRRATAYLAPVPNPCIEKPFEASALVEVASALVRANRPVA